jgi:5-formyltetrahydrofolate cyclo-ligase
MQPRTLAESHLGTACSEAKKALREHQLASLRALSAEQRSTASAQLVAEILAQPEWASSQRIGVFWPLRTEPDLRALWSTPGAGKIWCFPRIEGVALTWWAVARPETDLIPGPFRTREPDPRHAHRVEAAMLDLVLVPGLAFTAGGHRLGRGGGFYDRALAGLSRARRFGIALPGQLLTALPCEPHDQRVDRVL